MTPRLFGLLLIGSLPAIASAAPRAPTVTVIPNGRAVAVGSGGAIATTGTTVPMGPVRLNAVEILRAEQPLAVVSRTGDETLFIVEKVGRVRAFRNGAVDPVPVIDLAARVSTANERGLLGLAFSPKRPDLLYLDYTDRNGRVTVSEFPFDGTKADPAAERVLLSVPKKFNEHNAGTILFDNAGLLYVAIGDGGGSGDPDNNAQRLDTLLGKVLRIDPAPSTDGKLPYSIPPENPFAVSTLSVTPRKGRGEIIAFGLRNPWRISLDPTTGDLWIPDVGQNVAEEVNRMPKGSLGMNFAWRWREGRQAFKGAKPALAIDPLYSYPHKDGRCAVVGGAAYRGAALAELEGWYVFGDVCSGNVWALRAASNETWSVHDLGLRIPYLTAFGVDNAGELYATSLNGAVVRLDRAA